ncbi:3-oxoacyl-[acyl-carrier protein] reductase [Loktanella sp. PT4BL]|uniref:3-oxoacyl-[acyl-carrier-protein] reductase 1 n=1 Tax=Yoonia vestfoldensis TaxID=245188 RepID=A0A1Y0EGD5_9RHOB|nr:MULTISPECIES: SDR family oxidoreductase [Rhodobacterales]ARU02489.1 3-oxoacyl-[acyl-carrier-protein] reductase 1 [Yoonia vestfoldensis]PXW66282.1 3-oxoacyl-[acyl-carrier protein] reductase [Loktanella sp. PT4BL]
MTLSGQTAIVTGGSRGIGRAICIALAQQGAKVAFCHADDPEAAETLVAINSLSEGFAFVCDVSNEGEIDSFFTSTQQALGVATILVNNAGILKEAPLSQTEVRDFDRVIAVNLRGAFLASRAFVRRTTTGRIICIASDLGVLGRENMIAYCASKGAIISMTRSMAHEFAPDILVNAVAPGSIATDMTKPESMSAEALAKDLATPLARFGDPKEIASMVRYLAGPDSTFITGQCFGVNGGSVMR